MNFKTIVLPFDLDFPPCIELKAGDLSCMYEEGKLRYISIRNIEIARMIYPALRITNWQTVPYQILNEKIERNALGFNISYEAVFDQSDLKYRALIIITGQKNNTISFSMEGEALSDFKRNRIGLCVNHPPETCAGKQAEIMHSNGTKDLKRFPETISPHQPFFDVNKLQFEIAGLKVNFKFDGDIFETEDQRNWSDSSYKTYSTPLSIPFPVRVTAGDKIFQRIEVEAEYFSNVASSNIEHCATEERIRLPKIGYGHSRWQQRLTNEEANLVSQIPFDRYRVEVDLDEIDWPSVFSNALYIALESGATIDLVAFVDDDPRTKISHLVYTISIHKNTISSVLLISKKGDISNRNWNSEYYDYLKTIHSGVQVGYGSVKNFTELNRQRPEGNLYDFVVCGMNPQVHATDLRSIIENLQNQKDIVATCRTFTSKPIHISPITLDTRDLERGNADSSQTADPRQHSNFAASWMLLTLQNLSGASNLTLFQLTGNAGILPTNKPSPIFDMLTAIKTFNPLFIINRKLNGIIQTDGVLFENHLGERLMVETELQ